MKWIKISERLPEKTGKYFTRYKNYNGEQRSASFFDGWKFPHHVTEVEWLDESPVDRGVEKAAEDFEMTKEVLIKVLKGFSLFDLSGCVFEYDKDDIEQWVNAVMGGTVVDSVSWDGNIFKMMNNDGSFSPLNPMIKGYELSGIAGAKWAGNDAAITELWKGQIAANLKLNNELNEINEKMVYWKQRCEAAEKVIEVERTRASAERIGKRDEIESAYKIWQSLKQKQL